MKRGWRRSGLGGDQVFGRGTFSRRDEERVGFGGEGIVPDSRSLETLVAPERRSSKVFYFKLLWGFIHSAENTRYKLVINLLCTWS